MDNLEMSGQALLAALVNLMLVTAGQTSLVVTDSLAKLGLTKSQAGALWHLNPGAAAPSMQELAFKLRCDPSTVTSIADGLEAKKLIVRQVDPRNRRVKALVLSAKGRGVRQKLVDAMTSHSPVARLSEDEKRQLYGLLSKALGAGGGLGDPCAADSADGLEHLGRTTVKAKRLKQLT